MRYNGKSNEFLEVRELSEDENLLFYDLPQSVLSLIWFLDDKSIWNIDQVQYSFREHQVLFLTNFKNVETVKTGKLKKIHFNREFYCILDHDEEISCKGLLFYSPNQVPVMQLDAEQRAFFENLFQSFHFELRSKDELQLSMLQMLLKRLLILCTRLFKAQYDLDSLSNDQVELVRDFHFLVENHFKEKRTVACYAKLMHKSPKTITNHFAKVGAKSPLQIIQERIMIEARRLLSHTGMSVSEIAYELGFEDVQSFSRFFKKNEGESPISYKKAVLGQN